MFFKIPYESQAMAAKKPVEWVTALITSSMHESSTTPPLLDQCSAEQEIITLKFPLKTNETLLIVLEMMLMFCCPKKVFSF